MSRDSEEPNLMHCIYASTASIDFSEKDIELLLEKCRKNNAMLGVSGMLLFEGNSFFQILEGEQKTLEALYKKISLDKRHSHISKIIVEPIDDRDFADWSMGLAPLKMKQLATIEGLNDFFQSGQCFTDLDDSRAKRLLNAFKGGQWRSSITE
ncbi:BLUF domain-containing protein [Reinekea forsetii]|nr:BLUF domain-containing protein [Reinekea forsetii]